MKPVVRTCVVAVFALLLGACHSTAHEKADEAAMQLKLYHVPVAKSEAVAEHLGAVLEDAGFRTGVKGQTSMRVTQPFPGTVMVLAPAAIQPSIGRAISALDEAAGKPGDMSSKVAARTSPVRVSFWLVRAETGAGDDDPALARLAPTLQQVRATLGASHFVLDEAVSTMTSAAMPGLKRASNYGGRLTTARNHQYSFEPQITEDGNIRLRANFNDATHRSMTGLQTVLTLHPGEYVVLASAPGAADGGDTALLNMLVVRVDRPAPVAD